jgi:hypothetical protein
MMWEHLFWWALTAACVLWHCTITDYVAIRGASDIKQMLAHLRRSPDDSSWQANDRLKQERPPEPLLPYL